MSNALPDSTLERLNSTISESVPMVGRQTLTTALCFALVATKALHQIAQETSPNPTGNALNTWACVTGKFAVLLAEEIVRSKEKLTVR